MCEDYREYDEKDFEAYLKLLQHSQVFFDELARTAFEQEIEIKELKSLIDKLLDDLKSSK